jgi:ABC-type Fe3+/spermidine/putrescine transport system ATPase subunit
MFQEFALFPHKNVGQNVAFGLQMKREAEIEARMRHMLNLVGLAGFEERDVNSLSGGERQRVALARSLAPDPRLLMLDEPLGALDRALRERLMLEIRQILKKVGLTTIYVTHDQAEAFAVADRIVVMSRGHIEQDTTPEELYRRPTTPFVAQFLGFSNLLEATCLADGRIETLLGTWPTMTGQHAAGEKVVALIRPEAASLRPTVDDSIPITGTLGGALFRGRFYQITIATSGQQLTFEMALSELPPIGSQMSLWLDPAAILLLSSSQEKSFIEDPGQNW